MIPNDFGQPCQIGGRFSLATKLFPRIIFGFPDQFFIFAIELLVRVYEILGGSRAFRSSVPLSKLGLFILKFFRPPVKPVQRGFDGGQSVLESFSAGLFYVRQN